MTTGKRSATGYRLATKGDVIVVNIVKILDQKCVKEQHGTSVFEGIGLDAQGCKYRFYQNTYSRLSSDGRIETQLGNLYGFVQLKG